MASSTPTTLAEIINVHIPKTQIIQCFGETKIPGGTRRCLNPISKLKQKKALQILEKCVACLEYDGRRADNYITELSLLLFHRHPDKNPQEKAEESWKEKLEHWQRNHEPSNRCTCENAHDFAGRGSSSSRAVQTDTIETHHVSQEQTTNYQLQPPRETNMDRELARNIPATPVPDKDSDEDACPHEDEQAMRDSSAGTVLEITPTANIVSPRFREQAEHLESSIEHRIQGGTPLIMFPGLFTPFISLRIQICALLQVNFGISHVREDSIVYIKFVFGVLILLRDLTSSLWPSLMAVTFSLSVTYLARFLIS